MQTNYKHGLVRNSANHSKQQKREREKYSLPWVTPSCGIQNEVHMRGDNSVVLCLTKTLGGLEISILEDAAKDPERETIRV